ncbi:hypothetical protein BLD50_16290 [Bacillus cereus]|nr:hypothetical protein BLD50_16290 [Bacillus cereus]
MEFLYLEHTADSIDFYVSLSGVVGVMNISYATVIVGKSQSAYAFTLEVRGYDCSRGGILIPTSKFE